MSDEEAESEELCLESTSFFLHPNALKQTEPSGPPARSQEANTIIPYAHSDTLGTGHAEACKDLVPREDDNLSDYTLGLAQNTHDMHLTKPEDSRGLTCAPETSGPAADGPFETSTIRASRGQHQDEKELQAVEVWEPFPSQAQLVWPPQQEAAASTQLQAALEVTEHQNQELLQQLQKATEALKEAQLKSRAQDAGLQAMEDRSNRLQDMLELLRTSDDQRAQSDDQQEQRMTDPHWQQSAGEEELIAARAQVQTAADNAQDASKRAAASEALNNQLQSQLQTAHLQLKAATVSNQSLQVQLEAKKSELTSSLRQSTSAQSSNAASASQVKDLLMQLEAAQSQSRHIEASYQAASQERQQLASQLQDSASKLSNLANSHSELQGNHADLIKSHSAMTGSLAEMQTSYADLDGSYGKLEASHQALQAAQAWLKGSHSRLQAENSQLKLQLTEAQKLMRRQRTGVDDQMTSHLQAAASRSAVQGSQMAAIMHASPSRLHANVRLQPPVQHEWQQHGTDLRSSMDRSSMQAHQPWASASTAGSLRSSVSQPPFATHHASNERPRTSAMAYGALVSSQPGHSSSSLRGVTSCPPTPSQPQTYQHACQPSPVQPSTAADGYRPDMHGSAPDAAAEAREHPHRKSTTTASATASGDWAQYYLNGMNSSPATGQSGQAMLALLLTGAPPPGQASRLIKSSSWVAQVITDLAPLDACHTSSHQIKAQHGMQDLVTLVVTSRHVVLCQAKNAFKRHQALGSVALLMQIRLVRGPGWRQRSRSSPTDDGNEPGIDRWQEGKGRAHECWPGPGTGGSGAWCIKAKAPSWCPAPDAAAHRLLHGRPYATEQSAQALDATVGSLEGKLLELNQECAALDSEFAKLPSTAGRTVLQRQRKLDIEQRLSSISQESSAIRLHLKSLHVK
ncbi:hypothetical protein WJX74_007997 [Apatococcus lobatus]|uniref:Uncharacterized protein n=1 Tax=Apatococcus lobatus TaxID=904363 RepID=A0AAW1Q8S5_9CHLO